MSLTLAALVPILAVAGVLAGARFHRRSPQPTVHTPQARATRPRGGGACSRVQVASSHQPARVRVQAPNRRLPFLARCALSLRVR